MTGSDLDLPPAIGRAANRDPDRFSNPDRLDIAREDNRHLSFGFGAHFCLGAALSRMEGQITINAVVQRWPDLRLAAEKIEGGTIHRSQLDVYRARAAEERSE